MPKATRNRGLIVVREQLATARIERDQLNGVIDTLMKVEESLVDAYTRKPSTRAPRTRAARASVKKTWDSATTNATQVDLTKHGVIGGGMSADKGNNNT